MSARRNLNFVSLNDNILTIRKCHNAMCVSDFLFKLKSALQKGYNKIMLRVMDGITVYPNACVPIRGIIDHYQRMGIEFEFDIREESYLYNCSFISPLDKTREQLQTEIQPFDKLYSYKSGGQVADITQSFVNAISMQFKCEEGVLGALNWCINEVMDNVLTHSKSEHGFVMGQYHQTTHKVVFCIFDAGVGIFNSLKNTKHNPISDLHAIELSMQEGVSDGEGQGNGLFGLYQIVHENKGTLTITSGRKSLVIDENGEMKHYNVQFISPENRGTTIDFQLDLTKNIDFAQAFKSLGGYDSFDFDVRIDNMLNDDDFYVYNVMDNVLKNNLGTGTRKSGELLRNDVENIVIRIKEGIALDFIGVKMVSSSFIDEFIAKMVLDMGFIRFNSLVRIINMEPNVIFLCQRSLYMRIHDNWSDTTENS